MSWNLSDYTTPTFVPQAEPLWVGMMHTGWAVSGRVVGWQLDSQAAPFPRTDLPASKGVRGRAVVLVHASNEGGPSLFGPVVTIDANWVCRFVGTAEEAWRTALDLADQVQKRMDKDREKP